MRSARLLGGRAGLAVLLILLAAAPAFAADLPLVSSTGYATALGDGYTCVTTVPGGVIYAAGYAQKNATGSERRLLIVKYVDDGSVLTEVWRKLVGRRPMSAVKVAVDASGNVIVAGNRGRTPGSSGSDDVVVLKYSPAGDLLWASAYDGPAHGLDHVKGLALDAHGHAIVCGASYGHRTGRDFVTLKVTKNGRLAWMRRVRGPGNGDVARDVAVDEAGNVYVTGRTSKRWSASNSAIRPCSLLIAYSPDGRRRWVRLDDNARVSSGSTIDYCGPQDMLFFSGTRNWMRGYGVELLIRKLGTDTKGDHAFFAFVPGGHYGYWPAAAAVDGAGVPVVAGVGDGPNGTAAFLSGLTADGEDAWDFGYAGAFDSGWAKFTSVDVSADGRMLAAGQTASGASAGKSYRPTAFLVRYSPVLPVTAPLDYVGVGGTTSRDSCAACAVGDRGMYAVGQQAEGNGDSDAVLLKF